VTRPRSGAAPGSAAHSQTETEYIRIERRHTLVPNGSSAMFGGTNRAQSSYIQGVVTRFGLPHTLRESGKKERNIVRLVPGDTATNLAPRNHGDPKFGLSHNQHGLISLIMPQVPTAEFPTPDFQNIRSKLLCQTFHLPRRQIRGVLRSFGEHFLDNRKACLGE